MTPSRFLRRAALAAAVATLPLAAPAALAQTTPTTPVVRTYVPPNQLVAFQEGVGFDRFVSTLEPIFLRVTGKRLVDPDGRTDAIGVPIQGMHFMDAFVYVLSRHQLTYKETDRYFIIQSQEDVRAAEEAQRTLAAAREAQAAAEAAAARAAQQAAAPVSAMAPTAADEGRREAAQAQQGGGLYLERTLGSSTDRGELSTASSRQIKISAIIFDLNVSKARDLGINWRYFFSGSANSGSSQASAATNTGAGTGTGTGTTTTTGTGRPGTLRDGGISLVDLPSSLPARLSFAELGQILSILENEGVGRTIASPSITVRSGLEARIQVGEDIPVQTRDFQGNTQTQLIPTGTIARVVPTLVTAPTDTSDANSPRIDFIQIDALVERSAPGLFNNAVSISRNQTTTNVILLDGERTVIGGLYSTVRTRSRDGFPILKDLPLIGNLFGKTSILDSQREMIVILQAEIVRSPADRLQNPAPQDGLLEREREQIRQRVQATMPGQPLPLPRN